MAQKPPPYHVPVMAPEVVELLAPLTSGVIVDGTFGGGGHARALLAAVPGIRVLAIDRDPDAAAQVPDDPRLRFVAANFVDLSQLLADPETRRWLHEPGDDDPDSHGVAGVLLDLGVSSHQLDDAGRGFSYHHAGPLDMRMGPDAPRTAAAIVNEADAGELADIFFRFGEERHARRIARAIVAHRPFDDTARFAVVVADAVPAAARRNRHPARKVFQALRIAVNDELVAVADGLDAAIAAVRPGGRVVVIAYHSLEDRIVKRRFAAGATGCVCPPDIPVCVCDEVVELRPLTRKPARPSAEEVAANPRARSARLRAAEKVGPPEEAA
jgi:16S rRNA (cytosine1402-N4)-methyltransferase